MKRKAEEPQSPAGPTSKKSKTSLSSKDAQKRFRKGLFDQDVLEKYTSQYAESAPYKHAVINNLIDDKLLRAVRDEIKENVSFTPKETDIYKIHQSGDLANLDGLADDALARLPSLLALRDAMYSQSFRDYVAHITGCGPLSGRKTDMAINVYTPGCYLLCHDDVIGSRKVSYILYLTDPDTPWKAEWGGALRLFPVQTLKGEDGQVARTPTPDVSKVIPPAWNQLSFFAVQPGESFHDVEEVYHAESKEALERDGGRIRMAISGWFHIPQEGEAGFVEGAEEENTKNSGLMQLQGNPDQYDAPQPKPVPVEDEGKEEKAFDEADLEFLLKYMAPTYLTPDTIEQISETFGEDSSITLPDLLGPKFATRLREYVTAQEEASKSLPESTTDLEKETSWRVAKPPHKHRYLYMQTSNKQNGQSNGKTNDSHATDSPIRELIEDFLPSPQFRRWLQMATDCTITTHDLLARRFRRGKDYTLATGHEGNPRLELTLGITPTQGWGDDENENENEKQDEKEKQDEDAAVGGHDIYMAGDEGDGNEDAAIYKSSHDDEDNILFFQAAAWNRLSLVLRDSGALRFVKYVSQRAKGDRWDICGTFDVAEEEDDGEEEDGVEEDEDEEEEEEGDEDEEEGDEEEEEGDEDEEEGDEEEEEGDEDEEEGDEDEDDEDEDEEE